jgi:hypothetical protein
VLSGIGDALAEVATDDPPTDLDGLRRMLATAGEAKALPAAKVDAAPTEGTEPATAKGKRSK